MKFHVKTCLQVLPIDSDNNGIATCPSCSDLSSPLTPSAKLPTSSRRQLLLLQHQQRSSIDTETIDIDENDSKQVKCYPTWNVADGDICYRLKLS